MSQPPKSTMRAPAARWRALRGVVFGIASPLRERKRGEQASLARPSVLAPERLAPSVGFGDRPLAALQSPEFLFRVRRSFCLRVCGRYPFGGKIGSDPLFRSP